MQGLHRLWGLAVVAVLVSACSGSGNSGDPRGTAPPPTGTADSGCTGACANANSFLTVADVQRVIAQAVNEAQAQNQPATIAVVDRVGNVLGVYRMSGARATVTISSGRGVSGGLEGIAIVPSELAAISKAMTGAYLSSEGNAFSTRTASQIVQEHFNPGEFGGPSGPLFGVQFSNLLCSDVMELPSPLIESPLIDFPEPLPDPPYVFEPTAGPKGSPLGLSADPGGFPLYKAGTPVGGVGVVADGIYGLDANVSDRDRDGDELIATAATFGFGAPLDRRGDRITADGKTFRYSDVDYQDLARNPESAAAFLSLPPTTGELLSVFGFKIPTAVQAGLAFGQPGSGIRPDASDFAGLDAYVLVDIDNNPRFPPKASLQSGGLTQAESRELVRAALAVANRTRAQIRRPASTPARVSVSVVDSRGEVLALARTRDAPIFGSDVAVQKARTAMFFSASFAKPELAALPDATYFAADGSLSGTSVVFAQVVNQSQQFFADVGLFSTGNAPGTSPYALTPRAIGNIARPYFPDGIVGTANGPLSKPYARWSPFSDGLQYDLLNNQIGQILVGYIGRMSGDILLLRNNVDEQLGCTGNARLKNGIQIFPGGVPIYRGNVLVGAIGVSGDGVDQDDMIAALGLKHAAATLNTGIGHAPANMRADRLQPQGVRLRYVQCPQSPFLDSTEQNVCEDL